MKKLINLLRYGPLYLLMAAGLSAQDIQNFNYSNAISETDDAGLGDLFRKLGSYTLYAMLITGVIGVGWACVELAFFQKEIHDVKKNFIGGGLLIIIPGAMALLLQALG